MKGRFTALLVLFVYFIMKLLPNDLVDNWLEYHPQN